MKLAILLGKLISTSSNLLGLEMQSFQKPWQTAVFWSLLATGLRMGGMILVLPLVLRYVPAEQLGMWYIFLSVGALVSLMDMGFAPTISRNIAYVFSGAKSIKGIGVDGEGQGETDWLLLGRLVDTARRFYKILAAGIFLLMAGLVASWIYGKIPEGDIKLPLMGAWYVYALAVMVSMASSIWPAALIGINQIKTGQQIFAAGLVANYFVVAVGLFWGWQLWALVLGQLIMGLVIRRMGKHCFERFCARAEVGRHKSFNFQVFFGMWPQAWRAGLVSVGSYMIIYANTLVCGQFLGLEVTASYGLSLQLVLALVSVCQIWVTVKMPQINQLRVFDSLGDISNLFFPRLRFAWGCYLVAAVGILLFGRHLLTLIGAQTPLISQGALALLLVVNFLEMNHSLHGQLVVTENKNPFVLPALISGIGIVLLSIYMAPRYGVWGMILGVGLVQLGFNNWWTVLRASRGLGLGFRGYVRNILGTGV